MSTNQPPGATAEHPFDPLLEEMLQILQPRLTTEEGLKFRPYRDTSTALGFEGRPGKLTIGRGRNLDDVGIYQDEADLMTRNDLRREIGFLDHNLSWWRTTLNSARQSVLLDMSFNLQGRLLDFHNFLSCLQSEDYVGAAREMMDSTWARQVGSRADNLRDIILRGSL